MSSKSSKNSLANFNMEITAWKNKKRRGGRKNVKNLDLFRISVNFRDVQRNFRIHLVNPKINNFFKN